MARLYFTETKVDPPIVASGAVTSTAETQLWNVPQFTPIAANDPVAGRVYRVCAGGLMSANTTGGTITVTPRIGTTTAAGITLGASVAKVYGTSFASQPWFLDF